VSSVRKRLFALRLSPQFLKDRPLGFASLQSGPELGFLRSALYFTDYAKKGTAHAAPAPFSQPAVTFGDWFQARFSRFIRSRAIHRADDSVARWAANPDESKYPKISDFCVLGNRELSQSLSGFMPAFMIRCGQPPARFLGDPPLHRSKAVSIAPR
jgi:hypothetical protein